MNEDTTAETLERRAARRQSITASLTRCILVGLLGLATLTGVVARGLIDPHAGAPSKSGLPFWVGPLLLIVTAMLTVLGAMALGFRFLQQLGTLDEMAEGATAGADGNSIGEASSGSGAD